MLYEQRGVSAGKEELHSAIAHLSKGLYPNCFCKILPDILTGDDEYALIMHTDTAGTKPSLAYIYWRETGDLSVWEGVVEDAIVMNLDDMACAGAVDNFVFSSAIARNKMRIPADVLDRLINHANTYLNNLSNYGIKAQLSGGETADVGDVIRTVDVGFCATTRLKRKDVIAINIEAGDVIVGFGSEGTCGWDTRWNSSMGCNGLTSARHDLFTSNYKSLYPESYEKLLPDSIAYKGPFRVTDSANDMVDVGKLVLSPTRTYLPLIRAIIEKEKANIKGFIHCTGGGQTKVLHFAQNVHIIKDNLFSQPLVFQLIETYSGVPKKEMYRTFNMGHRLEVYVKPENVQNILDIAQTLNQPAQVVGRVEALDGRTQLTIREGGNEMVYTKTN